MRLIKKELLVFASVLNTLVEQVLAQQQELHSSSLSWIAIVVLSPFVPLGVCVIVAFCVLRGYFVNFKNKQSTPRPLIVSAHNLNDNRQVSDTTSHFYVNLDEGTSRHTSSDAPPSPLLPEAKTSDAPPSYTQLLPNLYY